MTYHDYLIETEIDDDYLDDDLEFVDYYNEYGIGDNYFYFES